MADLFDSTRRKLAKHITTEIVPDVLKEKNPEFRAKAIEVANAMLADPKFVKRLQANMEYEAHQHMMKYFYSKEFRDKCKTVAKGMVK